MATSIWPRPMLCYAKSLQSCPTLCDPIDGSHQASPSLGFSRQDHWSGLPFPSPMHESEKWSEVAQLCLTLSDPMDCSLPGSSIHGIFQVRVLEWGAIAFSGPGLDIRKFHMQLLQFFQEEHDFSRTHSELFRYCNNFMYSSVSISIPISQFMSPPKL